MVEIALGDAIADKAAKRSDPWVVVAELTSSRYADANCLLFGGSAARGTYNASSDIDLVVLFSRLPNSRRETFVKDGWLIDAQLHDLETLNFVLSSDARLGSAILANFILEAAPIPTETTIWQRAKSISKEIVDAGPPKIDLSGSRYTIGNMLSDLSGPINEHELMAVAAELYKVLALHLFRQHGRWLVSKKIVPRSLGEIDEKLEREFFVAFQICFARHDPGPVIALTKRLIPELANDIAVPFNWTYPASHRLKLK
jgi:predicted nucleotidyltransferase